MNNVVTTLAPSFLIGSSSFLQATRTPIKSRIGLIFGQDSIRDLWVTCPWASEKIPIDLLWEKCCDLSSDCNFEWIFFILADKKDNYISLDKFKFRQDPIVYYGVSCPLASWKLIDNVVTTLMLLFLIGSSSFLQVTRTTMKSRMEFENQADQTLDCGVSCPWASGKIPIDL